MEIRHTSFILVVSSMARRGQVVLKGVLVMRAKTRSWDSQPYGETHHVGSTEIEDFSNSVIVAKGPGKSIRV